MEKYCFSPDSVFQTTCLVKQEVLAWKKFHFIEPVFRHSWKLYPRKDTKLKNIECNSGSIQWKKYCLSLDSVFQTTGLVKPEVPAWQKFHFTKSVFRPSWKLYPRTDTKLKNINFCVGIETYMLITCITTIFPVKFINSTSHSLNKALLFCWNKFHSCTICHGNMSIASWCRYARTSTLPGQALLSMKMGLSTSRWLSKCGTMMSMSTSSLYFTPVNILSKTHISSLQP